MTSWRFQIRVLPWLLAPAWAVAACGHTDSDPKAGSAGHVGTDGGLPTGGTTSIGTGGKVIGRGGSQPVPEAGAGGGPTIMVPGISETPQTTACGVDECTSATVGPVFVDPCCAGESCGLDTAVLGLLGAPFKERCQALRQPGDVDTSCPTSAASTIPVPLGGQTVMLPINGFVGCCRDDGTCGVIANDVVSPLFGPVATLGLGCVDSAPFFGNTPGAACGSGVGAGGAAGAGGVSGSASVAGAGGEAGASVTVGGSG